MSTFTSSAQAMGALQRMLEFDRQANRMFRCRKRWNEEDIREKVCLSGLFRMISGPPFKYPYFIRVKNEEAIVMSIDTVTFCFGLFDCRWRPVKYVNGIDKKQKDLFEQAYVQDLT